MRSFRNSIVLLFVWDVFGAVTDEKSVSVNEGDAVTLHTEDIQLQDSDTIRWRFGEEDSVTLIAEISEDGINYRDDGRFKDRLQILDPQTGSLIIKNMRHKHSGRYKAEINTATLTTYRTFRVTVNDALHIIKRTKADQSDVKSVTVNEGGPVTLHTDVQTHRDDLILWAFGDEGVLIAKDDKEEDKSSIYDEDDVLNGIFRGRLKLDQSGSLTITNTKTTDAGVYHLKISSNRDTTFKTFRVSVRGAIW